MVFNRATVTAQEIIDKQRADFEFQANFETFEKVNVS
jgi:hypothetical protein